MPTPPRFIVIDDDKFNNVLCTMVIAKVWNNPDVVTFHDPKAGFEYMVTNYAGNDLSKPAILLLDINMPGMNGWDFLNQFNQILSNRNVSITDYLTIYVLSSSVDKKDIEKAGMYTNVTDYLVKPITKDTIKQITGVVD